MDHIETFKLVLQGGMFGLWAFITIYAAIYGLPMLRDVITNLTKSNRVIIRRLMKDFRDEAREMREWMTKELDMNRTTRHKIVEDTQKTIARVYIEAMKEKVSDNGSTHREPEMDR